MRNEKVLVSFAALWLVMTIPYFPLNRENYYKSAPN
jgi:hypothetical protein